MNGKIRLNHIIFAAIAAVSVVALVSFWLICNQKFNNLIMERVIEDYTETTVAVQKNVETLISYTEDFSKYVALDDRLHSLINETSEKPVSRSSVEIRGDWEKIGIGLIYSTSRVAGFGAYAEEKLLYSYFNSTVPHETDIISDKDLEQAKQQKNPVWTDLLMLEVESGWYHKKEYAFSVLKYVQGNQGEHLGTVALFVREASFSDILANADDTNNRSFFLVNAAGQIVSAENKDCLYANAADVLELSVEQYGTCMSEGMLLLEKEEDAPVLYMTCAIQGTPFRLVGRTILDEVQTQREGLVLFMQIVLVLSLGVAILVSWFVSKLVTKPLKQIIHVMKVMENNTDKKLRCPVNGIEEVSQLGAEFNRLMDKVDEAAEQIYQEQRQRRHNEVRLLQAQIVPHFLYNTLGMISALIKLNRNAEAEAALQNLASFYRLSLSQGKERITLKEEIEATRNYLELQRMRYIEYVDYIICQDKNADKYVVPKLLIQPIVENVLNHGLNPDGDKCTIKIETKYDAEHDCCTICVSDNGQGIAREQLVQIRNSLKNKTNPARSFGLPNIYQRMKLMYGERFTMLIDSEAGKYTKFTLKIQTEKIQERNSHV